MPTKFSTRESLRNQPVRRAVLGANDTVHVAYYGIDGTIWYRRLRRDGTLTGRQQLASGLGRTRAEYGAVLPLVFIPRDQHGRHHLPAIRRQALGAANRE